ncbi:MAG: hypothetical protein J7K72_05435 [Candidatus Aenigmarchaeota archaeon]|nr:hypothetical protein [Candidatus Aenigmarchaeota archaeon]
MGKRKTFPCFDVFVDSGSLFVVRFCLLIPELSIRWMMTTFSSKLLVVDIISGIVGSFIIGLTLAFII